MFFQKSIRGKASWQHLASLPHMGHSATPGLMVHVEWDPKDAEPLSPSQWRCPCPVNDHAAAPAVGTVFVFHRPALSLGLQALLSQAPFLSTSPPLQCCCPVAAWAQRSWASVCILRVSKGILGPWRTTLLSFGPRGPLQPAFPLPSFQASLVALPQQGCTSSRAPALRAVPSVSLVLSGLAVTTVSLTPAGCLVYGEWGEQGVGSQPQPRARDFESLALPRISCVNSDKFLIISKEKLPEDYKRNHLI